MNYHLLAICYHSSDYLNPKFLKKCPCRLATLKSKCSTTLPASQPQLTRERSDDNLLHRGLNARHASLNAAARAASGLASALHSWVKCQKTAKSENLKKLMKLTDHYHTCNDLTNFEYEVHARNGNGSYLNFQKLAWKNS